MAKTQFQMSQKIGILAHDAGASNLIQAWVDSHKELQFYFCLAGPALDIFKENYNTGLLLNLEQLIQKCDVIISGTSKESHLEHNGRIKAKLKQKFSISVIDHWVNYQMRFEKNAEKILPDMIWVFDKFAYEKAVELFPDVIIEQRKNIYLEKIVSKIKELEINKQKITKNILYVLEPFQSNSTNNDYLFEFIVLDFFYENLFKIERSHKIKVRLRPHPSEKKEKYENWIRLKDNNLFSITLNKKLEEDLAWADIVVGHETFALVVASAASKRCITSKLPEEENCRLMIDNLEYLRDFK